MRRENLSEVDTELFSNVASDVPTSSDIEIEDAKGDIEKEPPPSLSENYINDRISIFENRTTNSDLSDRNVTTVSKLNLAKYSKTYEQEENEIKPEKNVKRLDIEKFTKNFVCDSEDQLSSDEKEQETRKVNKINIDSYLDSVSNSKEDNSSGEEESVKPEKVVSRLDIQKYKDSLTVEEKTNETNEISVSKLNVRDYEAAFRASNNDLNNNSKTIEIEGGNVSDLTEQFASSLPNFMSGKSERNSELKPEKETSTVATPKSETNKATNELSLSGPGKVRALNSDELFFFRSESMKEKSLLRMYKNNKAITPNINESPQFRRIKDEPRPMERKGSLRIYKNCRELNEDEKSFFSGNFSRDFSKIFRSTRETKRRTSDVSDLSSINNSSNNPSDFRDRGKGSNSIADNISFSNSEERKKSLDNSILRDYDQSFGSQWSLSDFVNCFSSSINMNKSSSQYKSTETLGNDDLSVNKSFCPEVCRSASNG